MSKRITSALAADRGTVESPKAPPPIKLPKSDALKADLLYTTRQTRLALQKQVDALSKTESALQEYFLHNLDKKDATGIAGKVGRVAIKMKDFVSVEDWDRVYKYIVDDYVGRKRNKSEAFLILQKAIGSATVKDRWEHGAKIPGLKPGQVPTVSCVKV